MAISATAELDPARRLMFSPAWDRQAVVFDARSGDFWVVDRNVRDALCSASGAPARAADYLKGLAPGVIENLNSHGIIRFSGKC